ncbi:methyltransferase, partial [Elsinoe ampelina]
AAFAEQIYDPRAATYNSGHHPDLAKWFVDYADPKPHETLLDLACGTGLVAFAAADKMGHETTIIGVDISKGMLTEAWAPSSGGKYPNITFYNHDIADLDSLDAIKGRQFDVVTLCSAFVLLDDPIKAARSWLKYLKSGGRLIVDAVTPESFPVGLAAELTAKRLSLPIGYNTAWSSSEGALRKVLVDAGYQVREIILKNLETATAKSFKVEDVDKVFEQQIQALASQYLARSDIVDDARKIFREIFSGMAQDGKVAEKPSIWVATAIKP